MEIYPAAGCLFFAVRFSVSRGVMNSQKGACSFCLKGSQDAVLSERQ